MLNAFLIIIFSWIFVSCVPQSGGTGARTSTTLKNGKSTGSATPSPTPFTNSSFNFLQQASTQTYSILSLASDFSDTFYVRGNQIHNYLSNPAVSQTPLCLALTYSSNPDNKNLVLSAIPQSFTNLSNGQKEYYFLVQPAEKSINQVNCQTTGMLTTLLTNFPTQSSVYKISELCPSCTSSMTSAPLKFYSTSGSIITNLELSNLRIQFGISGLNSQTGGSCSSSSNCIGLGYHCCVSGQCVNDGQVKSGTTIPTGVSTEIANYPSNYKNYPQYYYICPQNSSVITPTPTPTPSVSNEVAAQLRLEELKDLYNCTKSNTDEMSICTYSTSGIKDSIVAAGASGVAFSVPKDDLNFTTINSLMTNNDITEVTYAGDTLYNATTGYINSSRITLISGTENDSINSSQSVTIKGSPSSNAPHDVLKIRYKINGGCERINSQLAKCIKYYVQGQSNTPAKVSDHSSGLTFKLPTYMDTSYVVLVKVNGIAIPESTNTWALTGTNVIFATVYPVYTGQKIEITYYVSSTNATDVTTSKYSATTSINTYCAGSVNNTCTNGNCSLNPIYQTISGTQTVTGYQCVYPAPIAPEPPMQQQVYISSKSVPHRYFDQSGVPYDAPTGSTPAQEGTAFSYTNNNLVKPNNLTSFVGINEIFGSMKMSDTASALPAKMVSVKKGVIYDLWVESGTHAPCSNCGNDYYSSLQKLFPTNFSNKGAGIKPSYYENNRKTNSTDFRSDDFIFGRACFVPPTMIPWSHSTGFVTSQTQRQARLKAQHFLYANGYQRDWYGFDYGALIGSYDGVTWFAIGNQRRTTAQTSKLFIAVNAPLGDLTTSSNFVVSVSEVTYNDNANSVVTANFESDGAECQKHHYCSADNDCIAKLGYEYACENVSGITTSWPNFNSIAEEEVGVSISKTVASIAGGLNGQSKRCVYRGRGAPCTRSYTSLTASNYSGTTAVGLHSCSSTTYCENLTSSKFNTKISRYGRSLASINADTASTTDLFGLGAKIPTRPLNFHGTDTVDSGVQSQFTSNLLTSICIPGKATSSTNPTYNTMAGLQQVTPSTSNGDKVLGIGITPSSLTTATEYVSQCSSLTTSGNFLRNDPTLMSAAPTATSVYYLAASQNIPTNSMKMTANPTLTSQTIGAYLNLFTPSTGITEQMAYQENTCLRAPGAGCSNDFECAPSTHIATKFSTLSISDFLSTAMNAAELKFWQEGLVCAQEKDPLSTNPETYDMKNNRCCRKTNTKLTVFPDNWYDETTLTQQSLNTSSLPLIDLSVTSATRYSRIAPAYDDMKNSPSTYMPLKALTLNTYVNAPNSTIVSSGNQFNTLHEINSKTCCTKNWVRSFHKNNGGGHRWLSSKQQAIDKGIFKYISWIPNTVATAPDFTCSPVSGSDNDVNGAGCEIKNFTSGDESTYLNWFHLFDLTGIPGIGVSDEIRSTVNTSQDVATSDSRIPDIANGSTPLVLPPGAITMADSSTYSTPLSAPEYLANASSWGYSINDSSNFSSKIKMVFSENEFNCCLPTGKLYDATKTTGDMCCTGTFFSGDELPEGAEDLDDNTYSATNATITKGICCLPDFTDVTLFLNRNVSSEGSTLPLSSIESTNGYPKDKGAVLTLATNKVMCCSGKASYGRGIATLKIPGADATTKRARRFVYNNDPTDDYEETGFAATSYDRGMKWNNHVYCVPADWPDAQ